MSAPVAVRLGSPAEILLSRLEKVRQRAPGSWIACCPAHDDCDPSLSVRECDDGTLLIKCFAQCDTASIVHSLGLELSDLFPPRPPDTPHGKPQRRPPLLAWDVLNALRHDLYVVAVAASDVAEGKSFSPKDAATLKGAVIDLIDKLEAAHVLR
jgi:hypothetical protein